jgi:hypothetical protein
MDGCPGIAWAPIHFANLEPFGLRVTGWLPGRLRLLELFLGMPVAFPAVRTVRILVFEAFGHHLVQEGMYLLLAYRVGPAAVTTTYLHVLLLEIAVRGNGTQPPVVD